MGFHFCKNLQMTSQGSVYQVDEHRFVGMIENHLHGIRLEELEEVFHQVDADAMHLEGNLIFHRLSVLGINVFRSIAIPSISRRVLVGW